MQTRTHPSHSFSCNWCFSFEARPLFGVKPVTSINAQLTRCGLSPVCRMSLHAGVLGGTRLELSPGTMRVANRDRSSFSSLAVNRITLARLLAIDDL